MKLAIRTQLTLWIMVTFLLIFFFLMCSAGLVLYLTLLNGVDNLLEIEEKRLAEMINSEFRALINAKSGNLQSLSDEFIEELNEIYLYEHQFVMISIESPNGRRVYTGGEREYIQRLLSEGFSSQREGFFNWKTDEKHYRILIRRNTWGRLVIGAENQTFFSIMEQFLTILLIGIPILLLLVFIGGNFLARRVMRPVVIAAQNAKNITLADLENKLSAYAHSDEFGILIDTFDELLSRLNLGVKQIRRFTQDAAHELRTPLTILRGELELLYQQEKLPVENRPALQKALDKTIFLNKIVDDLMLLAQSDSGDYQVNPTSFRLDQIVRETVEDIKILTQSSRVDVVLAACEPVRFYGEEPLIRRLLLNLSDNALKYTSEGQIRFSLRDQPESIELKISDTGIGIDKQDLPHIFDRFYRADRTKGGTYRGSGLGLSISKWIVEAHNGKIQVDSVPVGGTIVTIHFPSRST